MLWKVSASQTLGFFLVPKGKGRWEHSGGGEGVGRGVWDGNCRQAPPPPPASCLSHKSTAGSTFFPLRNRKSTCSDLNSFGRWWQGLASCFLPGCKHLVVQRQSRLRHPCPFVPQPPEPEPDCFTIKSLLWFEPGC